MSADNFIPGQTGDRKISAGIYYSLLKNPVLSLAAIIAALVFFIAVFGPVLSPHDPLKTDMTLRLAPPSLEYPFGNDTLGRCVFSRILTGTRTSIGLGISIVVISCILGVVAGLIAGYHGGLADEFLMRIADMFLSLPEIVAAMTIAGILGPGTFNLIFAFSVTGWMRYARLVRGITLSVREQDYVKSAQHSGVSRTTIIFRHILPANIGSVIVIATIGMAKAVISVSALGFLGFGVQPPDPEWGTLLMEGKDYIMSAPHLSIYPGIAIMLSALAFNLIGDKLRDLWDLKQQG
jgi:peptide/nickel transport system permease protein